MGLLTPILPLGVVTSCGAGSVGASDDPVSRWTTSLKVLVSACTNVVNDFESATTLFVGISMFGASNAELYVIWQSLILNSHSFLLGQARRSGWSVPRELFNKPGD